MQKNLCVWVYGFPLWLKFGQTNNFELNKIYWCDVQQVLMGWSLINIYHTLIG